MNSEKSFNFDVFLLFFQVTHLLNVLGFGGFCFLLGASKLINLSISFE